MYLLLDSIVDCVRIDVGYAAKLAVALYRQVLVGPLAVPYIVAPRKPLSVRVVVNTVQPPSPRAIVSNVALVLVDSEVPERVIGELDVRPRCLKYLSISMRFHFTEDYICQYRSKPTSA